MKSDIINTMKMIRFKRITKRDQLNLMPGCFKPVKNRKKLDSCPDEVQILNYVLELDDSINDHVFSCHYCFAEVFALKDKIIQLVMKN